MNLPQAKLVVLSFLISRLKSFSYGFAPSLQLNSPFQQTSLVPLKAVSPEFDEVCDTTGVTLTRFMHEVENVNPELSELAQLISGIQTASKAIANLVKRSQLPSSSLLGLEGVVNVQGEDQKKLDVITNDLLKRALKHTGKVGIVASEEEDTPMNVYSEKINKDVVYDEGSSYVTVSLQCHKNMAKNDDYHRLFIPGPMMI